MSCFSPLSAWRLFAPRNGRIISFSEVPRGWGTPISLACGKCVGCRMDHARVWRDRCMHEARMHDASCFVTLTYSDDRLPDFGSLVPDDLKGFHKRLHNRLLDQRGYGIRYYSCGEYGDENQRPHYHTLIFGFDFPDKLLWAHRGEYDVFRSAMLESLWPHGLSEIGELTPESAAYVARYCLKKVDGVKRSNGHYLVYDANGCVHERVPEFSRMSLRPGIGATYFAKYGGEIVTHDNYIVNGRETPSVRYYDKLIEKGEVGPRPFSLSYKTPLELNKRKRLRKLNRADNTPDRLAVKAELLRRMLEQKKRLL